MGRRLLTLVIAGLLCAAGGAPAAQAYSSGMSAEFPVGRCIDVAKERIFNPVNGNLMRNEIGNLTLATAVPCTDSRRDYRVVAQVAQDGACGPETRTVFHTRDVLVLCVVDDVPGPRG